MVAAFAQNCPILVYLQSWDWALKQPVSKRTAFTQVGVMVLGQKLMGEVVWPV